MKKQIIYLLGIILIGVTSFAIAYFYQEQCDRQLEEKHNEERVVTMLVQESRDTLGLERMIKKLLVEEKIRVDLQVVPDNQADSIVRMKVNTGMVPDLLGCNIPSVYGFVTPDLYLEELSDETWVEKLISDEKVRFENKLYAFPMEESQGLSGIIYNKDIFKQYGLKVPESESEFYDLCDRLKEKKVDPILLCADKQIPQMWMNYGMPLTFQTESECKETLNHIISGQRKFEDYPQFSEVVDKYLSFFQLHYVNSDYSEIGYEEFLKRLSNGTGAMAMGNYSIMLDAMLINSKVNLGIFPVPFDYNVEHNMVIPKDVKGFVIFKDSGNKKVAKQVLELWSTPEYLDLWFMDAGGFPAFEDVESGPIDQNMIEQYERYQKEDNCLHEFTSYVLPFYNIHTSKLWVYYMEAPINGDSGADIFERYQLDLEEYMNNNK